MSPSPLLLIATTCQGPFAEAAMAGASEPLTLWKQTPVVLAIPNGEIKVLGNQAVLSVVGMRSSYSAETGAGLIGTAVALPLGFGAHGERGQSC